jgi:voltage-gated potassium channel
MRQLVYWIVEGPNGREYSDNAGLKPLETYSQRESGHYPVGVHDVSGGGSDELSFRHHRFRPMAFLHKASLAILLVVLTLCLQCAGMAALIHWARAQFARGRYRLGPWRSGMLIVRFTTIIIVLHGLQILLWTGFYRWECLPSWESALYFSAGSYSTVGTGDLLLPRPWRIVGVVESGTGVLMGGLSVAFVFALITRLIEREARFSPELAWIGGQETSTAGVWERGAFGPAERRPPAT